MTLGNFVGAPTGSVASSSEVLPGRNAPLPHIGGTHLAGAALRVRLREVPGFSLSNMRWTVTLDCVSIAPDYSIGSLAQLF